MIERTSLDRELIAYLEGRSTNRAPAGLLQASLARVDTTRQRPAWLRVGRPVPSRRPDVWTVPVSGRVVLVVILLAALVIGAIVAAGSQRRFPPPFGLARSGDLVVEFGQHIGVMKPDGTGLTLLTSGPAVDSYPTWSPDGTRFALTAFQDGSSALIVMDAHGGRPITLAEHLLGGSDFGPAIGLTWSPDSRRVAFAARIGDAPEPQIFVTDADRPDATRIGGSEVYGYAPSWSPGGSSIAFKRNFLCCGGPPDSIWLIGPDGSNLHRLSTTSTDEALLGTPWSPDGSRLAFIAPGLDLNTDIFVINADGTGETNITHSIEDEFWPSWSPDGERIAFSRVAFGSSQLGTGVFVVDAGGTNRVEVPTGATGISSPFWSPDESRILGYLDPALGGGAAIAVLDPAGRYPPIDIPGPASASWQRLTP